MTRLYCQAGSRTIAYFDTAPGDTARRVCLLLHAFPLGAGMWLPQLQAAPTGWRFLAVDFRGFGGSRDDVPVESPTMADYAADAVDLLDSLGVSRAVLCGLSLGGYALFEALRQRPDLVDAIVLADTRAGADSSEGRAARRQMLALVERDGPAAVAADMMPKLLGATTQATRPDVATTVRRLIVQQTTEAVRGAITRMMTRADSHELLPTVRVPALVIVGEEDALAPVAESRRMADALPASSLVILPGAGHLSNLEVPDLFNRALTDFLAAL